MLIDKLSKYRVALAIVGSVALGSSLFAQAVAPADVVISDALTIDAPLTDQPGDPFRGLEVFINTGLGNCVACHVNFDVQSMQFLGDIGPELNWIGERYTTGELRAIIVDARSVFGDQTIMPTFYALKHGERTAKDRVGTPILTAQQIEDVVAYLTSLNNETTFDGVD